MRFSSWFRKFLMPLLFFLFAVGAVLILTYLSGSGGLLLGRSRSVVYDALPTLPPPLPGTPVAQFEQVNPAVIDSYEQFRTGYRPAAVDSAGLVELQPLGAYLPRSGNRDFALQEPTPLPTAFPYPTTPPLPVPAIPGLELPTLVPDAVIETEDGRTIPYVAGLTACAPAGLPVDGLLTQRFHRYHQAIDIGVPRGTPVLATHSGQVIWADWNDIGYGYLVIVQSGAFITYYAHNTSFNVKVGEYIGKGSILAWSGNTGNSSGPHVHYETRLNDITLDPLTFENRGYGTC